MKRRAIVKLAAVATGAAITLPMMTSLLTGCQAEVAKEGYRLQFFNAQEWPWVQELVDLILPKTDSPAASEVGVDKMIDAMVAKVQTKDQQADYRKGLTALIDYLESKDFKGAKTEAKTTLLSTLDLSKETALEAARAAYQDFKGKTVAYYLSSEEIATNHLNYLPVPGKYESCITLEEAGGKAWAL